jgi:hypothetical protein
MERLEQTKLEQAKKVMGDWLRMKERECGKRVKQVRDFLKNNGLVGWAKRTFTPTVKHSEPITVYDRTLKVLGVFGEVPPSSFIKQSQYTCETEGVDGLIIVFVITDYGWIGFWWEGAWEGRGDLYRLDYFLPKILAINSPKLVKVVGEMLDEGAQWWEAAQGRALEVIARQIDTQSDILNEMVIDLQLGG